MSAKWELQEHKPTQLVGGRKPTAARFDRRMGGDRRRRFAWWPSSLIPGSKARRLIPGRRYDDAVPVDHYPWRLRWLVWGLLVLSGVDAWLTMEILQRGGAELNPVMAAMVAERDPAEFVFTKQMLTSLGLILLVLHYHARWLRVVKVSTLLVCAVAGYAALVGYELYLLLHTQSPLLLV